MEVVRGLLPVLVNESYDYLMIDLAGITYGLRNPRALLTNIRLTIDYGHLKPSAVFVIDYSRPERKAVAESRVKWLRDLGLGFILAEDGSAEIKTH